jgi:hypothetical protein
VVAYAGTEITRPEDPESAPAAPAGADRIKALLAAAERTDQSAREF